jgi:hypothetical protein
MVSANSTGIYTGQSFFFFMFSEDRLLQDEVISVLPIVQSVNAMAKEMNKPVKFDMLLVSPEARGFDSGRTEVGKFLFVHYVLQDVKYLLLIPLSCIFDESICS